MKYSKNNLIGDISSGIVPEFLFFWGHRGSVSDLGPSCLSQWWPSEFTSDGHTFTSAEMYMMAGKARLFGDEDIHRHILKAETPDQVKGLGRKVANFDEATWDKHKYEIVREGSYLKFSQDPRLKSFLLATGGKVIAEASPLDQIWGIGIHRDDPRAIRPEDWPGENLLGFALMDVRADLMNSDQA